MGRKLTPLQTAFKEEYLVDLNGTKAAIRAGYSKKSASVTASRLLSNANVQTAIFKAMDERSRRTEITADRVLKEIAAMSFVDIRDIFTPAGNLKSIDTLSDDAAAAVVSVEVVVRPTGETDEDGHKEVEHVHKIRLGDKLKGLEMLCKHLGLFRDTGNAGQGGIQIIMNYGGGKAPKIIGQGITIEGN